MRSTELLGRPGHRSTSTPSSTRLSTTSTRPGKVRRDLVRGAAARDSTRTARPRCAQPRAHQLDRAADRLHRAGRERVRRVGRESRGSAGRHLERRRCCRRARAASGASPGRIRPPRNTPSASSASTVTAVPALTTTHGGGNSSLATARWRAATSDAQRSAPSCAGPVVAVDDAAASALARQPLDRHAPARELAFDAHARRFAGDVDADDARGTRQVLPVAQRERADLGVGDARPAPPSRAGPCRPHFMRLLPTSMTRIIAPTMADRGVASINATRSIRECGCRARCAAVTSQAAAQRDLAGEEARAARAVGEHQRAAGVDAGDRALDADAVGQQQLHRLALVGVAVLPFGGERREAVARVRRRASRRARRRAARAGGCGRSAARRGRRPR